MDANDPETWRWIWLIAAVAFAIGEMATVGSFFLAPFAVGATVAAVLSFLGVEPHTLDDYPRVFDRDYAPMRPETRAALAERFAEPNRRLERLLGREFAWS